MAGGVYIRRCQLYMTPKTKAAMHAGTPFLKIGLVTTARGEPCRWMCDYTRLNIPFRMTLCGSEVPQDRWRGRTAGSGMWTLTRDNLLSWSLDDPAITYG